MQSAQTSKSIQILDAAEAMIRSRGFHGFSFRDIAAVVGIKSASVHYHYPTKEALVEAVTRRYAEKIIAGLGEAAIPGRDRSAVINTYAGPFRKALFNDNLICLCGVLGAEAGGLPGKVTIANKAFFEAQIDWLTRALRASGMREDAARIEAITIVCALEGALIVAQSSGDNSIFSQVLGKLQTAARAALPS